jgi:hypothetical protein
MDKLNLQVIVLITLRATWLYLVLRISYCFVILPIQES